MKVKITVEYDVDPADPHELQGREHSNMVGMLTRLTRNRLLGFRGQKLGGDHVQTGWEVVVNSIDVAPVTKS